MRAASRPVVLGVVGDSAAGKTTITRGLANLLGPDRVTRVCADDYHRFDRAERARLEITPLHPDCNYLDILELHLERLHYGQPILKPVYDHATGTLVRPAYVQPRQFVVVDGLLGFHTAVLRQFYDVKVFLDPPDELRRVWKLRRDTSLRGYRPEEVEAELARREADARAFLRPQREHADLVVRFGPPEGVRPEQAGPELDVRVLLRPSVPHPDLAGLVAAGGSEGGSIRLRGEREAGARVDVLEVDARVTPAETAMLAERIWRDLPEVPRSALAFGDYQDRADVRHSDPLAITQLLLAYQLVRERRGAAPHRFAPAVAALSRLSLPASGADGELATTR
ncbi:MAG: phosphoribulokinase [Gemmatimonadota bacterium]